jgi:hypothetical protein
LRYSHLGSGIRAFLRRDNVNDNRVTPDILQAEISMMSVTSVHRIVIHF